MLTPVNTALHGADVDAVHGITRCITRGTTPGQRLQRLLLRQNLSELRPQRSVYFYAVCACAQRHFLCARASPTWAFFYSLFNEKRRKAVIDGLIPHAVI